MYTNKGNINRFDKTIDYEKEIRLNFEEFNKGVIDKDILRANKEDEEDLLNIVSNLRDGDVTSALILLDNVETIVRDYFGYLMRRENGGDFVRWTVKV